MSLRKYWRKRKFAQTPEPKGKVSKSAENNKFVVQKHRARSLHYDFRLEMEGVLRSWAVPKGLPDKKGVKRLAIQTEDHPIDYIDFQGEIPKGCYGAGKVKIWDKGKYKLKNKEANKIEFELSGKKVSGRYNLIKMRNNQWLIYRSNIN